MKGIKPACLHPGRTGLIEEVKMKRRTLFFVVTIILLLALQGCNLPGKKPTADLFPATPNATMTELFAQATLLTPDLTLPEFATVTPTSPGGVVLPSATYTQEVVVEPTQTVTVGITNTFTPPPTLTLSTPQRSSNAYTAKYLSTPPVLDGDWGEWTTTQFPISYVVYGKDSWSNKDDLEAAFRIGWDNNYLYLAVKVRDDKYVQKATGVEIYKGDSIELLLDVDLYGDFYDQTLNADDYQLGLSPGNPDTGGTKEAYLWYPSSVAGSRPQVTIAALGGDGLYRIEAAIPWSLFGMAPSSGRRFGFAMSVSDNDNTGSNVQQTMISTAASRRLTDPTTWGELVLGN